MLRRRHQSPVHASKPRDGGRKISGCDHDDAAGLEITVTQGERFVRVRQMFDDIEQRNDIHMTDPPHICFVCNARQDVQAGTATMLGCFLRQFNPGAIEIALGFLQKKSVRAAEVETLSAPAKAVNQFDAARKFPPQDGLGGAIVRIAVAALTGEIAAGVIGAWIETRGFRPSETATLASINIASVRSIAKRVRRDVSTGGACLRDHRSSGWLRSALSTAGAPVPTTENPVWSKYWSEAPISSIEKLVCVDHCPGSFIGEPADRAAKVYGNWSADPTSERKAWRRLDALPC